MLDWDTEEARLVRDAVDYADHTMWRRWIRDQPWAELAAELEAKPAPVACRRETPQQRETGSRSSWMALAATVLGGLLPLLR